MHFHWWMQLTIQYIHCMSDLIIVLINVHVGYFWRHYWYSRECKKIISLNEIGTCIIRDKFYVYITPQKLHCHHNVIAKKEQINYYYKYITRSHSQIWYYSYWICRLYWSILIESIWTNTLSLIQQFQMTVYWMIMNYILDYKQLNSYK